MERRKRRSAEDIEKSIIEAATKLIKQNGFGNLTVTGIMQEAEIEPVQFYKRYKDLDAFIDSYVKNFDYWFSDIIKACTSNGTIKQQYEGILCNLLKDLWNNEIMKELLRWEISSNNEISRRTSQLREFHTLPLCKTLKEGYSNSNIDMISITALIVGGIYYLILHNELAEFSGIDFNRESDRNRILKGIKQLSDVLFQETSKEPTISIASKMKKDGLPLKKIAEYTNLSLQIIEEL